MSEHSGRGGRYRQGEYQRGSQRSELDLETSSEDEAAAARGGGDNAAAAVQRPIRPNSYVRWSPDKVKMVLEAIVEAPSRIHQTNRFDAANNIEGQPKTALNLLEFVSVCVFS